MDVVKGDSKLCWVRSWRFWRIRDKVIGRGDGNGCRLCEGSDDVVGLGRDGIVGLGRDQFVD